MTRTILALIIMLTAAQSWAMNYPHPSTFATKAAQTNYSTNRQRDIAALQSGKASTLHASTHATAGSDPITPAAIGAATAAQGAKADAFKNLKVDYGCAGDGVTSDTACLNSAFVAATAGQTIFVPKGTYYLATEPNQLAVAGVTFKGEGKGSAIFKRGFSGDMLKFNAANIVVDSIGTVGNAYPTSGGADVSIRSGSTGLVLKNSAIYSSSVSNIGGSGQCVAVSADDVKIIGNDIMGSNDATKPNIGIWVDHGGNSTTVKVSNLLIQGNTFKNHGINAIYGKGLGITIVGNYFGNNHLQSSAQTCGYGTCFGGGHVNLVQKNLPESSVSVEIAGNVFEGGGPESYGVESDISNLNVTGNTINDMGYHGVLIQTVGTTNNHIVGNTIKNSGKTSNYALASGVALNSGTSDVLVSSNTLTGNKYGVRLVAGPTDRVQITNNTIRNNTAANIYNGATGTAILIRSNGENNGDVSAADPGANGILKRTGLNTSTTAAASDITALFGSGSCGANFMKGDGTCSSGTGSFAGGTLTGKLTTQASGTGSAPLNIPEGAAPTTPSNGDIWSTSSGLYGYFGGATVGPLGVSTGMTYPGAGVPLSTGGAWGTSYTVGTAANNLVKLDANAKLPAIDGSNLTNLPSTPAGTNTGEIQGRNSAGTGFVSDARVRLNTTDHGINFVDTATFKQYAAGTVLNWTKPNGALGSSANGLYKFQAAGSIDASNSFWNGLQIGGHTVSHSSANQFPTLAIFSRSATATDPTDAEFILTTDYSNNITPTLGMSLYGKGYVRLGLSSGGGSSSKTETMRVQNGVSIGTTADPGLGNLSVANFILTGYTALTDASATVSTDTTRLTCTTTTARTLTLPATAKKGTSTANLTVVGSGAAASVTFAAESGGSISWGDAGAPATTDTVASGKRQRYSCVSENAADTTTAAWDCYTAGGPF